MDAMKRKLIEARLEHIAKTGRYTPEDVLRDAKNPKSPLHDQFNWNDSEAAHQYRLQQARELIRSIKIDIRVENRVVSTVRYVRDPAAGQGQGYVDVAKLRTENDMAREALTAELEQVQARLERARSLADVFGLSADVDRFVQQLQELHQRLDKAA